MVAYDILHPDASAITRTLSFNMEYGNWYVDLPEFLGEGLGMKADLMMVDGADTFLDLLSKNGNKITLTLSYELFIGSHCKIEKIKKPINIDPLGVEEQEQVNCGANYRATEIEEKSFNQEIWLCPVTEYVFGEYPNELFISITNQ